MYYHGPIKRARIAKSKRMRTKILTIAAHTMWVTALTLLAGIFYTVGFVFN